MIRGPNGPPSWRRRKYVTRLSGNGPLALEDGIFCSAVAQRRVPGLKSWQCTSRWMNIGCWTQLSTCEMRSEYPTRCAAFKYPLPWAVCGKRDVTLDVVEGDGPVTFYKSMSRCRRPSWAGTRGHKSDALDCPTRPAMHRTNGPTSVRTFNLERYYPDSTPHKRRSLHIEQVSACRIV
jgi:hypothetical protein